MTCSVSSLVLFSAADGNVEAIKMLLAAGADIRHGDSTNWTAVMVATIYKKHDALRYLLQVGADVDSPMTESLQTPLYQAAAEGDVESMRILIAAKADINRRSRGNFTPLMGAIVRKQAESARFLLSAGADRNCKSTAGRSVMDLARSNGLESVLNESHP